MEFAINYDYRCPFAHIANDHVLEALADGADWSVRFVPFSLGQVHTEEGEAPIWERPGDDSGLLALRASVVVRDRHPGAFRAVHRDLFDLRHVEGRGLTPEAISEVLARNGLDAEAVMAEATGQDALDKVASEHEALVESHEVWGVPTFVVGEHAAFVRLTETAADPASARRSIERIVDAVGGWPELNELKHTTLTV